MMILQSHNIRSKMPESASAVKEAEQRRGRPTRREHSEVLVMHEVALGLERHRFPHLPPEIWNGLVGEAKSLLQQAAQKLNEAYESGIESRLPALLATDIPAIVYEIGRESMEMLLRRERGFLGTTIKCHEKGCDSNLTLEGYIERKLGTSLGMLTGIARAYYHGAECKHSAFPLDSLLGLDDHGLLPALQDVMALMSSRMSFPEATDVLNRLLPLNTNHTTVERVTATVAEDLQAVQDQRRHQTFKQHTPPQPEYQPGSRVAVMAADAAMFRTRDKKEPYHAFNGAVFGWLKQPSTSEKPIVESKRYLAHVADIDPFWEYVTTEYYRLGFSQAKTVVALSDGALYYLNRFELLQQSGQEVFVILDFWHASEHLAAAAKGVFGEKPEAALWSERAAKALKRGKIKILFKDLESLAQQAETAGDEKAATLVRDKIRYFTERKRFLRYKEARRRGFPIGSGMIEGGVRFVGKDRLHDTGMRWSDRGADNILQLRSLDASGEWDRHCRRQAQQRHSAHQERQRTWQSLAA